MRKSGILIAFMALVIIGVTACGGGKKEISKKAEMLIAKTWLPDVNANIKAGTDTAQGTTGIKADIELKGDVKGIADFFAGSLRFARDNKDKTKLSYERKYGKGILSTSVLGYWELSQDETKLIMKEWDSQAGKEKAPVSYEIVELTDSKLVLKKEGATTPDMYVAQ